MVCKQNFTLHTVCCYPTIYKCSIICVCSYPHTIMWKCGKLLWICGKL